MRINQATYLIAELAGDAVPFVLDQRRRFNPDRVEWPVDITIAGSSGIGTFKEGQHLQDIIDSLSSILFSNSLFSVIFTGIECFQGTGIYHLTPEREKFDRLHTSVAKSGVLFNLNSWPYTPHCTLRVGSSRSSECDKLFSSVVIPEESPIECFSIYQPKSNGGRRLHRF